MREIKFRAWDKESKYMKYDVQLTEPDYGEWDCFAYYLKNDNYILMQYTGLKDKNEKEIYESDLVKWEKQEGVWHDQIRKLHIVEYPFVCGNAHLAEIIGNIYENPELGAK